MKRVVLIGGGLLAILVIVLIAIPFVVNANRFRPALEARLSSALGREVTVGNLSLSLFSGTVEAEELRISEDPAFGEDPFLRAGALRVAVELMPLVLSRQLIVTGITLEEPEIALIQSAEGAWNVSSLGRGGAAAPASNAPPAVPDASGEASQLNLLVHSVRVTGGRLTVLERGVENAEPFILDAVNIEVREFATDAQFPLFLSARLGGGSIELDGAAGPINSRDAAATPVEANYQLAGIDLAGANLFDPATGISGMASAEGRLVWSGGTMEAGGIVRATRLTLAPGGIPAEREASLNFGVMHDEVKHTGRINRGVIQIGEATANLTGSYDLTGGLKRVDLELNGADMPVPELAAMLPALNIALPRGSSLEGGVATVTLRSSGRLDQLSSEGSLSVTNATLANFDLGTKMRVIEALTGTRASRNTQIQRMAVNLARTPSGMTIRDIQLVVPTIGQLTGAGTVGSNQELNFQMRVTARAEGGLLAQAARDGVVTAPFFIQGTTADPVIRADTKGLAAEAAKTIAARELEQLRESGRLKGVEESEVGRKALGILDRVLGGNKGEEQK